MLRGILGPDGEQHHGVRISDEAIVAAVNLSARYIPARQLPDKAVSLLDTACARVAVSASPATPARIADLQVAIAAAQMELEIASKERASAISVEENEDRIAEACDATHRRSRSARSWNLLRGRNVRQRKTVSSIMDPALA